MAAVVVVTASGSAYLGGWNWPSGIARAANGHHGFRNSSGHPAHPAFREPELDAVLRASAGRPSPAVTVVSCPVLRIAGGFATTLDGIEPRADRQAARETERLV